MPALVLTYIDLARRHMLKMGKGQTGVETTFSNCFSYIVVVFYMHIVSECTYCKKCFKWIEVILLFKGVEMQV